MPTVTAEHRARSVLVGGALVITAFVVVVVVAMLVVPDDGCGSWVEQLNFVESSDLCRGTR